MSDENPGIPKPNPENKQSDEAFDDILFSSDDGDADISPEPAPQQKKVEPVATAASFDDAFDDVLFLSDEELAEKEKSEKESGTQEQAVIPQQVDVKQDDQSDAGVGDDDEFFFAEEPVAPEVKPKPVTAPPKLEVPVASPAPKPVKNTESDEYSDALFSSDDELEDATEIPSAPPLGKSSSAATEKEAPATEEYEDALFSSDEELDSALDHPTPEKVVKPEAGEGKQEEFKEALFASDDALEDALDNPTEAAEETAKPLAGRAEAEKEEVLVSDFDLQTLLTDLSSGPILTENSSKQSSVRLKDRAVSYIKPLSLFEEKDVDEKAHIAYEQQKIAEAQDKLAKAKEKAEDQGAKAKAKKLFSMAKGGVDEIVGAGLPERLMPLEFKFVLQKPKKDVESLMSKRDMTLFLEKKGATVHQVLKKIDGQLLLLSKTQLSDADRQRFLDEVYAPVVSHAYDLQKRFNRRLLQPSDMEFGVTSEHCTGALKNIINGYKQLFANIYEANNFNYKRQQEQLIEYAKKLFELLLLEQGFLAARQVSVSNISIKSMNKIYMALFMYESESLKLRHKTVMYQEALSFSDLFIRYQLHLCFDHCKLSPKYNLLLINYLNEHSDFVEVLEYEQLIFSPDTQFLQVSDCFDSRAKYLHGEDVSSEPGQFVYLNCMLLLNRIKNDFKQCYSLLSGEKASHSDTGLKELSLGQVATFTAFINNSVADLQQDKRAFPLSAYQAKAIGVTTGFDGCVGLLNDLRLKPDHGDAIAPAGAKSKKTNIVRGLWGEAFRDETQLFLQTQMSPKAPDISVGKFVLIEEELEAGVIEQQIALISRMERVINNMINVTLTLLGGESAAVKLAGLEKNNQAVLSSKGDEKLFVRPCQSSVFSDEVFKVSFVGEDVFVQLDKLQFINDEVMIYTMA